MAVELTKPWTPLTEESVNRLPGQLGVYQLADDSQNLIYMAMAGGRSLFGLKGEIAKHLGEAAYFRVEVTTAYLTRYRELMAVFVAQNGEVPQLNAPSERSNLGRISVSPRG